MMKLGQLLMWGVVAFVAYQVIMGLTQDTKGMQNKRMGGSA